VNISPSAVVLNVVVDIDTLIHSNTDDLMGILSSPNGTYATLFHNPGDPGGENMLYTTITDTARMWINTGVAPFIGTFFGMDLLSPMDNSPTDGNWIFSISDQANNNENGTWYGGCITLKYFDPSTLGTEEAHNNIPAAVVSNYPNPFTDVTNISFTLEEISDV